MTDLTPDEFALKLNLAAGVIQPATIPVVKRTAEKVADTMRDLIPRGTVGEIRTADTVEVSGHGGGPITGPEADIGPTHFVGRFIEHGTVKQQPRPFIERSVAPHEPAFLDEIGKVAADVIRGRL